ncbi:MAG TPA: enoyl-CoA hydratase/isomerase family protein [Acidimicrobiales bacterium]|nr:enoyl-CoA hydratase/isomerase family protein [Acidimicrobiales bacterium]
MAGRKALETDADEGSGDDAATDGTRYEVVVEDRGKVRVVLLDRAKKLNAFNAEGYRKLKTALDEAAEDESVAVCVITGSGRAFSAGVDLDEMSRPGGPAELGRDFDPLLERLATFPKPLIGAVNGVAVGFGATLLLHCDLVVVDEKAEIRMPFVALGTCAEAASSWLLPQRVGRQNATWMMLSGAPLSASEAVKVGFAFTEAPEGTSVEESLALAEQLAVHEVAALVANKALLRDGFADQIAVVWEREKKAMLSIAQELGSIGR